MFLIENFIFKESKILSQTLDAQITFTTLCAGKISSYWVASLYLGMLELSARRFD